MAGPTGTQAGSTCLSEPNGIGKLHSSLPFLIVPFQDILIEAFKGIAWGSIADEVVTQPAPTVLSHGVQSWTTIESSSAEFEFATFDIPLLTSNFNALRQCCGESRLPIVLNFGLRRIVR